MAARWDLKGDEEKSEVGRLDGRSVPETHHEASGNHLTDFNVAHSQNILSSDSLKCDDSIPTSESAFSRHESSQPISSHAGPHMMHPECQGQPLHGRQGPPSSTVHISQVQGPGNTSINVLGDGRFSGGAFRQPSGTHGAHRSSGGPYHGYGGDYSRERKYMQKIYVDGLFPPHVRPASVLIGTRGMNHNRMQASGCTVQLRGRGCSQPSSQWPDEPVHLTVRYDHDYQFERFKEILKEIVEGYEAQNPKRARTIGTRTNKHETPTALPPPPPTTISSLTTLKIQNWNITDLSEAQIAAEVELLWLLRVFLAKEQPVPLDNLMPQAAAFFRFESLDAHLQKTSIPPGPNQLYHFVSSCPYFFSLKLEPDVVVGPDGDLPAWSRPLVGLQEAVLGVQKEALRETHRRIRREQQLAASGASSSTSLQTGEEPGSLQDESQNGPPVSALCLLLQALHFLIREEGTTSFIGLEDRFLSQYGLPLKVSVFGYNSVVALIKAHPQIFSVTGSGRDMRLSALPQPDFFSTPVWPSSGHGHTGWTGSGKATTGDRRMPLRYETSTFPEHSPDEPTRLQVTAPNAYYTTTFGNDEPYENWVRPLPSHEQSEPQTPHNLGQYSADSPAVPPPPTLPLPLGLPQSMPATHGPVTDHDSDAAVSVVALATPRMDSPLSEVNLMKPTASADVDASKEPTVASRTTRASSISSGQKNTAAHMSQCSVERTAPRLLGLLGKLASQKPAATAAMTNSSSTV